jgi:hypothetical protein
LSAPPFGAVGGESTVSNEVTATVGGTQSSVMLEWIPVQGAAGYAIYRTLVGGAPGSENIQVATVSGANATYLDAGTVGPTQLPPATNTALMKFPMWVPVSISQLLPSPFSMPESAFVPYSGSSAQAPIGSLQLPSQPFPWTPIVWGHIGAKALSQTATQGALGSFFGDGSGSNVMVGCEVLLGDPRNGTMVARGFGNNNTEVNIMPHYSTKRTPTVALTPSNDLAVVPAFNSTVAQATLYVNLWNDGRIGKYSFKPQDCQLFCLVVPVTE